MPEPSDIWIVLAGALLAVLALYGSFRALRRKRLIGHLPTAKIRGVFIGFVELSGTAETEIPLVSHLAQARCVHYRWSVQEHWSRWVTETYTDSKGRPRTRTRHESGWTAVADGGDTAPFYLQDETGVVQVVPDGATIEGIEVFDTTCESSDPLYYDKGPSSAVANSDHRRRFSETAIPLHSLLYVLGQARERDDVVAAEIAYDEQAPTFLISCRAEDKVASGLSWQSWVFAGLALVLALAAILVADAVADRSPSEHLLAYIAVGAGFVVAWGLGWLWMAYNSLVDLRQRVDQAWSLIDVQLRRRSDLIPRLVEVVRGLRDYEHTLHTELVQLRGQIDATAPGTDGPDALALAPIARMTVERYPELEADEAFADLQEALIDTEERIALARAYFNEIATHLNTRLELIPDRWVAPLARLRRRELMSAAGFERAPVKVELAR